MTWRLTFTDGRWQRRFVPQREVLLPRFDFDVQRGVCRACDLHRVATSVEGVTELHCTYARMDRASCSFMRLPDQACGPKARHFTPLQRSPK